MTINGFLVVNKDVGMTSHSVVSRVRRLTAQKKAGHTGTLDPFATGVLPVALGDATKYIQFLDESLKEYQAVMRLGATTDTQDCEGKVLEQRDWQHLTPELICRVAGLFTGDLLQIPPMYSAIKQDGVPLYRIARQGGEVERAPRNIFIHSLVVDNIALPDVTFTVRCSRGTYVRTLAHDIGDRLGCGAHLVSLSRISSGSFSIESALTLAMLEEVITEGHLDDYLIPAHQLLSHLDGIELNESSAKRLTFGIAPGPDAVTRGAWPDDGKRVLLQRDGVILAVAEGTATESVRLLRVFV